MSKILYITTLPNGSFSNAGRSWYNLDIDRLASEIVVSNYDVKVISIDKLLSESLKPSDIVVYCSSDEPSARKYIQDVLYIANKKCLLVPAYEHLLAHENKGFQQLYRELYEFGDLEGGYHFDIDNLPSEKPLVYKRSTGAGSSGVTLVESGRNLKKIKKTDFSLSIRRRIINFLRYLKLDSRSYSIYRYRHKGFYPFVWQKFIPELTCDYKIICFGERYYVLKRGIRKNDFRASGSGDFSFIEPSSFLLDYAEKIFSSLSAPYASLDIAESKEGFKLIEYQVLNFGPYTANNAKFYYVKGEHGWSSFANSEKLLSRYARSIGWYLKQE